MFLVEVILHLFSQEDINHIKAESVDKNSETKFLFILSR